LGAYRGIRMIPSGAFATTDRSQAVYPVVFIDAINVKIRDGNVANRPIYIALGVTVEGTRDVLGLWAGEHGDGEGYPSIGCGSSRRSRIGAPPTCASWCATA